MPGAGLPPLRAVRVDGLQVLAGVLPSEDLADHVAGSLWTFAGSGRFTCVSGQDIGAMSVLTGRYTRRGDGWEFSAAAEEVIAHVVRQVWMTGTVEADGELFRVTVIRGHTATVRLPFGPGAAGTTTALRAVLTAVPVA